MILRILAQQSPDSEVWLKRHGRLKFRGLKYEFGKDQGFIWKIAGALVIMICNLEGVEGLKCKIWWARADSWIEFENRGLNEKSIEGFGWQVNIGKPKDLFAKWLEFRIYHRIVFAL
jgi:hypothetical protein